MKLFYLNLWCLLFALTCVTSSYGLTKVLEIGPKELSSFDGVGDQVVFHWPAYNSSRYLLQYSGTVNQSGSGISVQCAEVNVTALVRLNAIPVPNPRHSYLPEHTLVQHNGLLRSDRMVLSAKSQGQVYNVTLQVDPIEATDLYAAIFLPYDLERIEVAGLTKDCHYYMTLKVYAVSDKIKFSIRESDTSSGMYLTRKQYSLFGVEYQPSNYIFNISDTSFARFYWEVFPLTDSGGTLDITISVLKTNRFQENISVIGCLSNELSLNASNCSDGILRVNSLGAKTTWHIPFPLSGMWTLGVRLECGSVMSCANLMQIVQLNVLVRSCIDGCFADRYHGKCGIYRSDSILFSACRCKVGWRGLACNDGRNALSYATQLLHTLLLTLSNFMFIPCVLLAIYRKFYTESLVYFFVTFMSTFYHACDQPGQVVYCILPYETLQFSDFLSSITAIWFTLIAVAKLPLPVESFLQILGLIAMSVCVSFDRFNVWTTVVPAVVGVIIVTSNWGFKCHKAHKCYPGRKKTLFSIIPGTICAGVGLCLYAFVETTENYYIVHSMWHILMATSVLFLLPVGPKRKSIDSYNIVNNTSTSSSPMVSVGMGENFHNL